MYDKAKEPSREYRSKPLYFFAIDDNESILQWIRSQHKIDREDLSPMYERFDDNLAAFLGKGRTIKSLIQVTDNGYNTLNRDRSYTRLKVNRIKNIVEILVSRYLANKTNFFVTPRQLDDFGQEAKAKTSKRIIDSILQERNFEHIKRELTKYGLIFGESYINVMWNSDLGSAKKLYKVKANPDSDEGAKNVDVVDRQGDVDFEILDPRFVTVQHSSMYKKSEWVIYVDYIFPEKLKLAHPEFADKICSSKDSEEYFNIDTLDSTSIKGLTRRYRLWHRVCREMPKGRYIEATDETILINEPFSSKQMVENQLFPICQLVDFSVLGSPRGRAMSVLEPGRPLQLAIHNLWSILIRNLTKFPPMRVWPAEVDKKILEKGTANDIFLSARTTQPPQMLYADPVSPSLVNSIRELDAKLLQLSSITPALQGQGGANMEVRSGTMLQIFKDIDAANMLPMNDKINELLQEVGTLVLATAVDNYKDNDKRLIKLFGKRSRFLKQSFKIEDINIPVDVRIQRGTNYPQTMEGKIAQIESILNMFPAQQGQAPLLSREEVLEILELGEPEKLFDSGTASIDTAEQEIGDILDGKDVTPPNLHMELFSYYETYRKALQHPRIKDKIPRDDQFLEDIQKPVQSTEPGYRLLRQILEIEMLLWEKSQDNPLVKQTLMTRFPFFPSIFKPEPEVSIDPAEMASESERPEAPIQPQGGGVSVEQGTPANMIMQNMNPGQAQI